MDQARGGGDLGMPHCPHRTLKRPGMDVLVVQGQHELSILIWFLIFGELRQKFIS